MNEKDACKNGQAGKWTLGRPSSAERQRIGVMAMIFSTKSSLLHLAEITLVSASASTEGERSCRETNNNLDNLATK